MNVTIKKIGIILCMTLVALSSFVAKKINADFITPTPIQKELKLNAAVTPHSSDFQLDFTSSAKTSVVNSGEIITYTITYGSSLPQSTSLTIEAEWSLGTIPSKNLFAFDVASYVSGSASRGHNEAIPTIDLAQKKISWKIENFPKNTKDKSVTFKLKTPSDYVTNQNIEFTVKAKLSTPRLTLPQKERTLTYSPTTLVPKTLSELEIMDIEIRELHSDSATLFIQTSLPSKTTIYYGKTTTLDKSVNDLSFATQKVISINDLLPNAKYYLRVYVETAQGSSILTKELYTIATPATSFLSAIDMENAIIGAFGTILKNKTSMGKEVAILFPKNKSLDIFLPFIGDPPSHVSLKIINAHILGIYNLEPLPYLENIRLLETEPGVFSGKVTSPSTIGTFDLMMETQNSGGDYTLDRLTKIVVAEPMKVLSLDNKPIENAYVSFELYNPKKRMFEYFPAETFGSKNPSYSQSDGSVDTTLITGRYKAQIASLGYISTEKIFDFSPLENSEYPKFTLTKSAFSPKDKILYYWEIFYDSIRFSQQNIDKLILSNRFLQLIFLLGLTTSSVLSILLTAHRLKIKFEDLVIYLQKYVRILTGHNIPAENLFTGFVESNAGVPIHGVSIILLSAADHKIVYKNITNFLGEFRLPVKKDEKYELIISKKGFQTLKKSIHDESTEKTRHQFQLEKVPTAQRSTTAEFFVVISNALLHMISDVLLFTVIFFHIFYIVKFGISKDLPIALITLFNIVLYVELIWKNRKVGG